MLSPRAVLVRGQREQDRAVDFAVIGEHVHVVVRGDTLRITQQLRRPLRATRNSTTRETWATCTCPECGKGRQEISVPDHGRPDQGG